MIVLCILRLKLEIKFFNNSIIDLLSNVGIQLAFNGLESFSARLNYGKG